MKDLFLETERVYLRRMSMDDFAALGKILKNPEVMYAWEYDFTDTDVKDWIDKNLSLYEKYGLGYFLALSKKDGSVLGQAALMPDTIDGKDYLEVGYIFDKKYWGNGYATECAKALSQYAIEHFPDKELILEIRPENEASIKVAQRLCVTLEGTFTKIVRGKSMNHFIFKIY